MNNDNADKKQVLSTPRLWTGEQTYWCPGCHYGIILRLILETIEELGIEEEAIGVTSVGCSYGSFVFYQIDMVAALHGRAPDVATGLKHAHYGDNIVFTIQGDGDLAAIGMGEVVNAANRFEKLTTIFLNNGNYGTTGGQLAPTTILGQYTTTTPDGRNYETFGFPVHVPEMMATMKGVAYTARSSVHSPAAYARTRKYMKKAFQKQVDNAGYSLLEIISACPPGWKMSPVDCNKRIEEIVLQEYPLGEFKDVDNVFETKE